MSSSEIKGVLEIDHERGVIYFHAYYGITQLRICSLPKPIPDGLAMDITHMFGTNWDKEIKS